MVNMERDVQLRWVIGLITTAIVGLIGSLALFDRNHISLTAEQAVAKAIVNERRLDVLEERTNIRLKNIEEDLREIKTILKEMK